MDDSVSLNALAPHNPTEWHFIDDGYNRKFSNVFSFIKYAHKHVWKAPNAHYEIIVCVYE